MKKTILQAVELFLDSEGFRLQRHLDNADASWTKAKAAFLKQLETGAQDLAVRAKVERTRVKRDALQRLITLKMKLEEISIRRQDSRKKIEEDLNNGVFNPDDGAALNVIVKSLEETQVQIYYLFEVAGMDKYLKPTVDEDLSVVVKSTQASPTMRKATYREAPGSSHVPQTQYMKQTPQVAFQEVWSPAQEIKFAQERIMASPPPPPKLMASNQWPPRTNTKSTIAQPYRYDRVSESPERHSRPASRPQSNDIASEEDYADTHYRDNYNHSDFSDTMGAPPPPIDIEEEDLEQYFGDDVDDDDDDSFHDGNNNENTCSDIYDWKGDIVATHTRHPPREVFQETSANQVQQPKPQPSTSPKKPQLNMPGMNHPWSRDVRDQLLNRMRLRGFRPGQLDAINTTLSGESCFVLMPTGGGKSLCYQLPSVINSGKTRGVTLVVSPLLSLMEDQVSACKERFFMQAYLMNGESTAEQKSMIINGLNKPDPENFIQLLYVTPEMLSKNQRMIQAFQQLHRRRRLARIVIDEAHCVSQWGHDFRPDYKALGEVLGQFSGVPIIALTATATQLVRTDVMSNLNIRGCRVFSQSFNRPNLSYEVLPKTKGVVKSIAELIRETYHRQCGIIYCLSRKTCESVAKNLTELGISAYHYHAGMDSAERSDVQRKWQSNEYHVIVVSPAGFQINVSIFASMSSRHTGTSQAVFCERTL